MHWSVIASIWGKSYHLQLRIKVQTLDAKCKLSVGVCSDSLILACSFHFRFEASPSTRNPSTIYLQLLRWIFVLPLWIKTSWKVWQLQNPKICDLPEWSNLFRGMTSPWPDHIFLGRICLIWKMLTVNMFWNKDH